MARSAFAEPANDVFVSAVSAWGKNQSCYTGMMILASARTDKRDRFGGLKKMVRENEAVKTVGSSLTNG